MFIFHIYFFDVHLSAQKVTKQYFNKYWIECKNGKEAEYYRYIQKTKDSLNRKLYLVKDYYLTDTLQMEGSYLDENVTHKQGKFSYYFSNGQKKTEAFFVNNMKQGSYTEYFETGKVKSFSEYQNDTILKHKEFYEEGLIYEIEEFKKGELNGKFYSFYKNGKPIRMDIYDQGIFTTGKCFTESGQDTLYFPHEILPSFSAGYDAFIDYIRKGVQAKNISCGWFNGEIDLSVIVDENGNFKDPFLIYTSDNCYFQKVINVLETSPHLTPGKIDGIIKPQRIYLEIRFPE
jgi:antitoxin component YwqK of YwqJK toxin-antitoxin module